MGHGLGSTGWMFFPTNTTVLYVDTNRVDKRRGTMKMQSPEQANRFVPRRLLAKRQPSFRSCRSLPTASYFSLSLTLSLSHWRLLTGLLTCFAFSWNIACPVLRTSAGSAQKSQLVRGPRTQTNMPVDRHYRPARRARQATSQASRVQDENGMLPTLPLDRSGISFASEMGSRDPAHLPWNS